MKKTELLELAKEKGLIGRHQMTKEELEVALGVTSTGTATRRSSTHESRERRLRARQMLYDVGLSNAAYFLEGRSGLSFSEKVNAIEEAISAAARSTSARKEFIDAKIAELTRQRDKIDETVAEATAELQRAIDALKKEEAPEEAPAVPA